MIPVLVAIFGAAGSLARWWVAKSLKMPWGTFTVNLVGSALIGAAMAWFRYRGMLDSAARVAVVTGFLGGFTTYSAFCWETWAFLEQRSAGTALVYAGGTLLACLLVCAGGAAVTARLLSG